MKKIKLLLLLFYSSIIGFSQTNTFVIKVIDAKGQIDSVIMGYRNNATVGIDTSLGETDYYGKPYSEIDIRSIVEVPQKARSIQRDTVTVDTFWLFSFNDSYCVLPFSNNIDLKKDYREYAQIEHFIVQIHAKYYPVTVKVSYFNFEQYTPYCIYFNNYNGDSISGDLQNLIYGKGKDTIVVFKDSIDNKIIGFHPQVIESVGSQSDDKKGIELFPNPVLETLSINILLCGKKTLNIYDSRGVVIESQEIENNKNNIDVSSFPKGVYFIRVDSVVKKFIKL